MHQFFRSEFFNFELVRILGSAPLGGCDIAEFLDAVGMIKQDDALSWHNAWYLQAEKAESIAKDASRSGDRASARRAYLRASNYFRASQYMMHDRTECHNDLVLPPTERSIANFKLAAKLLDGHVHELAIPFEGHQLPGYLFLPPPAKRLPGKIPVMINTGGADSTQEELYYLLPAAGPDLGYAVLTFEGPGQGIVLRRDKLYQRLDWEVVTGRVLDHLFQFSAAHVDLELDLERVSISGASMGGHYAIRGASDLRIKACVAMDPFYDMWELALVRMPKLFVNAWLSGWVSDRLLNSLTLFQARFDFRTHWESTLPRGYGASRRLPDCCAKCSSTLCGSRTGASFWIVSDAQFSSLERHTLCTLIRRSVPPKSMTNSRIFQRTRRECGSRKHPETVGCRPRWVLSVSPRSRRFSFWMSNSVSSGRNSWHEMNYRNQKHKRIDCFLRLNTMTSLPSEDTLNARARPTLSCFISD